MIHLFHKWGKWNTEEDGDVVNGFTKKVVGKYAILKRTCETCDTPEFKRIKNIF